MHVDGVWLRTGDGVLLAADVYRPAGIPRGGVVTVHGFSASRRHPAVVDQVVALARRGLLVVAYDGRGHGTSSGACTLGRSEAYDVAAAVVHLRPQVPAVVTVGASMGAVAVLGHALRDPDLAGIVLVSTATSWWSVLTPRGVLATALTRSRRGRVVAERRIGVRISDEWQPWEPSTDLVRRVRVPVAIVHGLEDRMVRPSAAVELYEAASEPRRLELVERMGHSFAAAGIPAVVSSVDWAFDQTPTAPSP